MNKIFFLVLAFIVSKSCAMVHMKTFPSQDILSDPNRRKLVDTILQGMNMTLADYSRTISFKTTITPKQQLTKEGMIILMSPEFDDLRIQLNIKYPGFLMHGIN